MKIINCFSTITPRSLIFLLLLSVAFTGCRNYASGSEEVELSPTGAVLYMNGEEIVRYENQAVTGSINVAVGEETTLISIHFLAENGDEFQPDEPEHSLQWNVVNESIAEIEQSPENGKWNFHLTGKAVGQTRVTFELMHGDHSDFTVLGVPVNVN